MKNNKLNKRQIIIEISGCHDCRFTNWVSKDCCVCVINKNIHPNVIDNIKTKTFNDNCPAI